MAADSIGTETGEECRSSIVYWERNHGSETDSCFRWAYGIMEPSRRCPILSKEKIDMAVIPCVSADREGRRLGHGAGFYDRFLDGVTFPKILVCYKELMMDQVPTEEHDILMDQVICDE